MRAALLVVLLMLATNALSDFIPGYPDRVEEMDPRDVAILPKYCKSTQGFRDRFHADPQEVARWYNVLGPGFHAMHHYCWALMQTNRAMLLARTAKVREFYLESAIQNIDYVIRSTPPDFVMLPELFTKKGENLLQLKRTALGVEALEQAIAHKPDYWPPYAVLSDHFKKTGSTAEAREWLRRGLEASPNTPALARRMHELDKAGSSPGEPKKRAS